MTHFEVTAVGGRDVGLGLVDLRACDVELELSHRPQRDQALIDRVSLLRLRLNRARMRFLGVLHGAIEFDQHVAFVEMIADPRVDLVDAAGHLARQRGVVARRQLGADFRRDGRHCRNLFGWTCLLRKTGRAAR